MKIPSEVMGLGGLITVEIVDKLTYKGKRCAGLWKPKIRTISINKDIKTEMLHTYFHELVHAATHDSGLNNILTHDDEEAFCDMIGMARVRELE